MEHKNKTPAYWLLRVRRSAPEITLCCVLSVSWRSVEPLEGSVTAIYFKSDSKDARLWISQRKSSMRAVTCVGLSISSDAGLRSMIYRCMMWNLTANSSDFCSGAFCWNHATPDVSSAIFLMAAQFWSVAQFYLPLNKWVIVTFFGAFSPFRLRCQLSGGWCQQRYNKPTTKAF